tara:strand:- start:144 stop:437 length:294 start_codon:yes stop_codon:yes gene_type:complete
MTIKSNLIQNADGTLTLVSGQEDKVVKDLYDMNSTDKFTAGRDKYKGDSTFSHRVARIPLIVVEKMMRDKVWGNQERMKEWLNHPDNTAWRTTKGKV